MRRSSTIGFLVLAVVASGCAASKARTHPPAAQGSTSASPISTDTSPETVIDLPTIGSVSWTCKGENPVKFSTTFLADNSTPTETVSYSLDGARAVSKTLQPGQHLSTPFTATTSHVWTVNQPIDPWNTHATITVALSPDNVFGCVNPSVTVSRVRVNNT
jgi:hypothetical protein